MKIIQKKSKSTYYDIDDYCCKEMRKQMKRGNVSVMNGYIEFRLMMDNQYSLETLTFKYCPWCGKKVIDEIEEMLK